MLSLSAKFQVSWDIHSTVPAIFKIKGFQGHIRPLVQILEKPGTRVKYFLMLYLPAKCQLARFSHSKLLTIF